MKPIYDMGLPHPMRQYPDLIINAAITGMVPTKEDTPHVPVTEEEIIEDAIRCCRAGASIIHIHVRDEKGAPTYEKNRYARIIKGIRKTCPDVILCASTSGRVHNTFEKRSDVLDLEEDLKPDMGSLTMGSLNFPGQASINTPDMINGLALKMKEKGIVPEIEIFETGMIWTAKVLIDKGVLEPPFYFNLLLGSIFSVPATLFDLACMVKSLPPDVQWGAAGIGRFQQKMNYAAMLMGGHVRVGLEDNLYFDTEKKQLATNEMLIKRIVRFAKDIGRTVATPERAREMMGLPIK
ncbi:MAG: 3-keto-5-aminohexanoate cleavage protein [Desulfobacterales bacterium]|nr:3-keto-5-aminohexanoate cleavage protein [Desulfobacterales bacterium]